MSITRHAHVRLLAATAATLPFLTACSGAYPTAPSTTPATTTTQGEAQRVDSPADLVPTWLASRGAAQLAAQDVIKVFHDFRFEDRVVASGIAFTNRVVDDASKTYLPAHYDHGTALAAADVDNDDRTDLYFVNQIGVNELWRNLGDGRFEDITASAGVGLPDRIGVGASFADIDNDGDADLYATTVRGGNALFQNDGSGHFTDITNAAGLTYSGHSSGAAFFDYDHDGLLDLYVANVGRFTSDELRTSTTYTTASGLSAGELTFYGAFPDAFASHLKPERDEPSKLYRNLGQGRFQDVTEAMGLVDDTWSGDVGVLDGNADGWSDLYVLNMQGNDEYYENDRGQRFVKRSREVFPKTPWGSMGIAALDYNHDAKQDLYVTDMHSDMSQPIEMSEEKSKAQIAFPESLLRTNGASIFGNALFRNDGNDTFAEVSDTSNVETYWPWGPSAGDVNADGYEDLFVTAGMGLPYRYAINSLLLNDGGETFRDSEFVLGVEPRRDGRYGKAWFRAACSGADASWAGCKDKSGNQDIWSALSSRSSALVDLENDGDLDIVTNDFNSEPMVLVSNLTDAQPDLHYLKVRLSGSQSNRDGLGAVVRTYVGDQTLAQVNDGKSGYLAQSQLPLYFGLGSASTVNRIEVDWPSGRKQVLPGPITANQTLEVTEPTD